MQLASRADEGTYHSRFMDLSTMLTKVISGWVNGGFYSQLTSLNVSVWVVINPFETVTLNVIY